MAHEKSDIKSATPDAFIPSSKLSLEETQRQIDFFLAPQDHNKKIFLSIFSDKKPLADFFNIHPDMSWWHYTRNIERLLAYLFANPKAFDAVFKKTNSILAFGAWSFPGQQLQQSISFDTFEAFKNKIHRLLIHHIVNTGRNILDLVSITPNLKNFIACCPERRQELCSLLFTEAENTERLPPEMVEIMNFVRYFPDQGQRVVEKIFSWDDYSIVRIISDEEDLIYFKKLLPEDQHKDFLKRVLSLVTTQDSLGTFNDFNKFRKYAETFPEIAPQLIEHLMSNPKTLETIVKDVETLRYCAGLLQDIDKIVGFMKVIIGNPLVFSQIQQRPQEIKTSPSSFFGGSAHAARRPEDLSPSIVAGDAGAQRQATSITPPCH